MPGASTRATRAVATRRRVPLRAWLLIGVLLAMALAAGAWLATRRAADPEAVWSGAEADLRAGRFAQARAGAELLARLRSPTPLDWMLRGQVALAKGRTEAGAKTFTVSSTRGSTEAGIASQDSASGSASTSAGVRASSTASR